MTLRMRRVHCANHGMAAEIAESGIEFGDRKCVRPYHGAPRVCDQVVLEKVAYSALSIQRSNGSVAQCDRAR